MNEAEQLKIAEAKEVERREKYGHLGRILRRPEFAQY